jgi:hypothetical protein
MLIRALDEKSNLDLLRQALRQAASDFEQTKHLRGSSSSKLALLALDEKEKSKLESPWWPISKPLVTRHELCSPQTEDKVLDAEYKLEDMRKEGSELKSRLCGESKRNWRRPRKAFRLTRTVSRNVWMAVSLSLPRSSRNDPKLTNTLKKYGVPPTRSP